MSGDGRNQMWNSVEFAIARPPPSWRVILRIIRFDLICENAKLSFGIHTAVYRDWDTTLSILPSPGGWVDRELVPRQQKAAAEKRQSSRNFFVNSSLLSHHGRQGVQRRRQSSDPNLFTTSCSRRSQRRIDFVSVCHAAEGRERPAKAQKHWNV